MLHPYFRHYFYLSGQLIPRSALVCDDHSALPKMRQLGLIYSSCEHLDHPIHPVCQTSKSSCQWLCRAYQRFNILRLYRSALSRRVYPYLQHGFHGQRPISYQDFDAIHQVRRQNRSHSCSTPRCVYQVCEHFTD
jgi:hypothetical protein